MKRTLPMVASAIIAALLAMVCIQANEYQNASSSLSALTELNRAQASNNLRLAEQLKLLEEDIDDLVQKSDDIQTAIDERRVKEMPIPIPSKDQTILPVYVGQMNYTSRGYIGYVNRKCECIWLDMKGRLWVNAYGHVSRPDDFAIWQYDVLRKSRDGYYFEHSDPRSLAYLEHSRTPPPPADGISVEQWDKGWRPIIKNPAST